MMPFSQNCRCFSSIILLCLCYHCHLMVTFILQGVEDKIRELTDELEEKMVELDKV